MDGILYEIVYSEKEGTIRFHNDSNGPMKRTKNEKLIGQVQDSEDARDVVGIIKHLRPDLKINDSEIEG